MRAVVCSAVQRLIVSVAIILLAAIAPRSHATCSFARLFSSFTVPGYSYLYTPGVFPGPGSTTVTETMRGSFWMMGNGVPGSVPGQGIDNGRFEAIVVYSPGYFYGGWVRGYPYPYGAYIQGPTWASSPDIHRCPHSLP